MIEMRSSRDPILGFLYGVKALLALVAALSLLGFGSFFASPWNPINLSAAGLVLGVCIPDVLFLMTLSSRSGKSLTGARIITYLLEMAVGAGCFKAGSSILDREGHGGEIGLIPMAIGVLVLLFAQSNLFSFAAEKPNGSP